MRYDGVWKEAFGRYFREAMELLFAEIAAMLRWGGPNDIESLDTELVKLTKDARTGKRIVDKLVKMFTHQGDARMVHAEAQMYFEDDFDLRMYVYDYRIYDVYKISVWNLVVLGDNDPVWRPSSFGYFDGPFRKTLVWVPVKLLDFADRLEELESGPNLFARLVVAHLVSMRTKETSQERQTWKLRLLRGLLTRNLYPDDIHQWARYIDWLLPLDADLEDEVQKEVAVTEKEHEAPYITSWERKGHESGLKEGRERGLAGGLHQGLEVTLDLRFGAEGLGLMPEIRQRTDSVLLQRLLDLARRRDSTLDEVRRLLASEVSASASVP